MSEASFFRERRMFVLAEGDVQVAGIGDERSHLDWCLAERWTMLPQSEKWFEEHIRGYVLNNRLVAYRSQDGDLFSHFGVAEDLADALPRLRELLPIDDTTEIYLGGRHHRGEGLVGKVGMGTYQQFVDRVRRKFPTEVKNGS